MKAKVTVSVEERLLDGLDQMVQRGLYDSRSSAMEAAITALRCKQQDEEFERNLALLDPDEERAEADLGMGDYQQLVQQ